MSLSGFVVVSFVFLKESQVVLGGMAEWRLGGFLLLHAKTTKSFANLTGSDFGDLLLRAGTTKSLCCISRLGFRRVSRENDQVFIANVIGSDFGGFCIGNNIRRSRPPGELVVLSPMPSLRACAGCVVLCAWACEVCRVCMHFRVRMRGIPC